MAQSLVKYNTPILVVGGKGKKGGKEKEKEATQTEDILNSILPPREWTEDGQLWIQFVSSTPATRLDVVNLQEKLDHALQTRQARETGVCPVREELYAQCFDELIRQITINCAERGLLLLRVRDEARMTIAAYCTLYESSIAYGVRKVGRSPALSPPLPPPHLPSCPPHPPTRLHAHNPPPRRSSWSSAATSWRPRPRASRRRSGTCRLKWNSCGPPSRAQGTRPRSGRRATRRPTRTTWSAS